MGGVVACVVAAVESVVWVGGVGGVAECGEGGDSRAGVEGDGGYGHGRLRGYPSSSRCAAVSS